MSIDRSARTGSLFALGTLLFVALPCCAQDRAAGPGKDDGAGGTGSTQPAPRQPAGMVRFSGGSAKIGIDRKPLMEHVKNTELGRISNMEKAIEEELSLSTPEWEAEVAAFWIAKYETTNAQYQHFLQAAGKTSYTVPPKGQVGDNTLEQISRRFLLSDKYPVQGGKFFYPVAVDWKGLYELNMEALNPTVGPDGKPLDPAARPAAETFREKALPPGTRIVCYRYSVPADWRVNDRLRATVPPGQEEHPVKNVSLVDAMACARFYGNHIPTEIQWEAACRGPGGTVFPEGPKFKEMAHAWKNFNAYLEIAQAKAKDEMKAAKARLARAEEARDDPARTKAEAQVADLKRLIDFKIFPENSESVEVGLFPAGRSPCGAHDMIGNADEWVSTDLVPWPGTDSGSSHRNVVASILKGGHIIERDTLLFAPFRRFFAGGPIRYTQKFRNAGFRMARYEAPGVSLAAWPVREVCRLDPPVLPRGEDRQTKKIVGPTLEIDGAVGIHRVIEVDWSADQAPDKDPAGKVFHTGRAEGLCLVPASGTPYREPNALRNAASEHAPKDADAKNGKASAPRDVPFLGLLVVSEGVTIKADGVRTVETVQVPLTAEEKKRLEAERQARIEAKKKASQPAPEEEKKDGEGDKKDEEKAKIAAPPQDKGGKKDGDKQDPNGGKQDGKPADAPPAEEPKPEGEEDDEEKDPDEEPPIPTTKAVQQISYKPGNISGKDHPRGFLFGLVKIAGEVRPVLWEPRLGTVGSLSAGGTVLLETPYAYLPADAIALKKVSRPGIPWSEIKDLEQGEIRLVVYVPIEGKGDAAKREAIEVGLKLKMVEFPTSDAAPWLATQAQGK